MTNETTTQRWDAVIVGTGMGGATLGLVLAKAGKRVLLLEKGKASRSPDILKGRYPEEELATMPLSEERWQETLARGGREWATIEDHSARRCRTYVPFIGAGAGGSTALYGMALERFFPEDFAPRAWFASHDGSSVPEAWPIQYGDLAPFYDEAEQLFRVRGTPDPLRGAGFRPAYLEPPALSAGADELRRFLEVQGCHPYRLPMACEYVAGCNCCQGYLCPNACKNDGSRICLEPAVAQYGATLLDECEVVRLEATRTRVERVLCIHRGQMLSIGAETVILAAGALQTPGILLRSASEAWPDGLANRNGLVGRNLMRHYIDLYVLQPRTVPCDRPAWKELAFNDYYLVDGQKLGSVQGFGALPPAPQLVQSLFDDLRQGPLPAAQALLRPLRPLLRKFLHSRLEGRLILASVVEDRPYLENRVELGPDGALRLIYRLHAGERRRIASMRARMDRLLRPYRPMRIKQAENNQRLAHACGTCRFGTDPTDSVLDAYNRAHGLDNLYVVDASFMPSSGGINPSLTIAANALRVARHLLQG